MLISAPFRYKSMSSFDEYIEKAIEWAFDMLGSTDYRSICLAFVEDAYEKGADIELDGYSYAKEAAVRHAAEKDIGVPPKGAYVFYDCWGTIDGKYQNWGHVGISIGDGKVIHAWGVVRLDDYLEVQNLKAAEGWTQPRYIGWISAEEYPYVDPEKQKTSANTADGER